MGLAVAALTVGGATVGVLGCRGHGLRSWVVHVGLTAVMVGMLLPALSADLAAASSFLSAAALLPLMVWTTLEGRRQRSSPTLRLNSVRELTDLSAMSLLVIVMPVSMVHSDASGVAPVASHAAHLGHAFPALSVTGLILALWSVSLVIGGLRARRIRRLTSAPFTHGIAGSALMLLGMATMTIMTSTI
jgi:hypothetical protein